LIGPSAICQTDPDEIEAFLLFVSTVDIRRINFDATGYQTLVTGLSNGVAIDFDYINDRIYWSDVNYGHIRSAPLSTGSPITTLVSGTYVNITAIYKLKLRKLSVVSSSCYLFSRQ